VPSVRDEPPTVETSGDSTSLVEFALLFVAGLGAAFVGWVVVRLMARPRPH